ncbi:thiamine-phosphate pyrophosphorylase [Breoghania corrubedonensis]|uniref:Thiamine-phosphate pyrophosphorylase n=1 Tax=Breoghania corrubedonensis TaxID=665038 RepID=A0A2T5V7C1_9HYPH|nr:thiamine phosphate synthase [Breoghania corrubedonensis]PTW59654.1 thiamine-phosphate pyrophosphorylase [Breoghania corrubedonensis]
MFRSRLFLITPTDFDAEAFAAPLGEALSGGDVACLLITLPEGDEDAAQLLAEKIVPIAQEAGVAALILNDTRVAGRARADGVQIDSGLEDLKLAQETFQPNRIVGVGHIKERHHAMELAELDTDYVFFGMLDLEEHDEAHRKTIDFADWWAEVFEIPCVALAGRDIASVRPVAETKAEFVALRAGVWDHPKGPKAAVEEANAILDTVAAEIAAAEEAAG